MKRVQIEAQVFKVTDENHMREYLLMLNQCAEGEWIITPLGDGARILLTCWQVAIDEPNIVPLPPF